MNGFVDDFYFTINEFFDVSRDHEIGNARSQNYKKEKQLNLEISF